MRKTDANITVRIPDTAMERLLIAPSTSPISIALAVPIACDEVPSARPFDIGSVMWNILHIISPKILPTTPVSTIIATVMVTYPPSSSDMPIPIAVVIDLGRSVMYSVWFNFINFASTKTVTRLVKTPERIPANTAL